MLRQWLRRYVSRLRFPRLLAVTATVFVLDMLIPDVLPFVDEILLALLTALLASLRERRPAGRAPRRAGHDGEGSA